MSNKNSNFMKLKVESDYMDSFVTTLESKNIRYGLGLSELIDVDDKTVELQTVYIDMNTVGIIRTSEKPDGIYSHTKMKSVSRFFVCFAKEIVCCENVFYEYTLADVIDEFDSYEEAFNLFEKIEKADPLQTVIIVERIADTEITDKTQPVEGKTYWVATD